MITIKAATTEFEDFLREFDRDWIEKIFKRFQRDLLAGAPLFTLKRRYALTEEQLGELVRLVEIRCRKIW